MSQMRSSRSLGAGISTSHLLDGCVASLNTSLDLVNSFGCFLFVTLAHKVSRS